MEVEAAEDDGRDSEEKVLSDMEDKDSDCEDSPDSSDDDKRSLNQFYHQIHHHA